MQCKEISQGVERELYTMCQNMEGKTFVDTSEGSEEMHI